MIVGERYSTNVTVCTGDNCKVSKEVLAPGVIYEVSVKLDKPVAEDEMWKVREVIAGIRKKYPSINVNYLEVSSDRRRIIIQMFDPEARVFRPEIGFITVAQIIAVIIALIALVWVVTVSIEKVSKLVEAVTPPITEVPKPVKPVIATAFWLGVAITAVGIGSYLITKSIRQLIGKR